MPPRNQNSRPGRPPTLDDEKRKMIIGILAVGGSRSMAARHVGCAVDTIARTARREPTFGMLLRKAEVDSDIQCLTNLHVALQDARQWRAATWTLERRRPTRFGRQPARSVALRQFRRQLARLRTRLLRAVPSADDRRQLSTQIKRLERSAARLAGSRLPERRRQGPSHLAAQAKQLATAGSANGAPTESKKRKMGVQNLKKPAEKPSLAPVYEQFRRFAGAPGEPANGHANNGKSPGKTPLPHRNGAPPQPILR